MIQSATLDRNTLPAPRWCWCPKNEQIDIELLRPLQNHPRDVMRGRAHDLAVRLYTGGGQSVDERLHRISVCALALSPAERTPRPAPP
jgi:hypothetical protein